MHEYFWGEYNAEFYHEFCAFKETLRYDYLGLAWTDILGGAQISRDFYGWRDDVYAPGSFWSILLIKRFKINRIIILLSYMKINLVN